MAEAVRSLVLAVIQEHDLDAARRAVEGLGAPVFYLTSSGGFLERRNATLLIGLPPGLIAGVIETLRQVCRERVEYLTVPLEGSPLPLPAPLPVTVGGAAVFIVPIERFEEF